MVSAIKQATDVSRISPPSVYVRGLTYRYRSRQGSGVLALSDITFTVSSGSFMCLVGPSGCGKSTLLECIAGLKKSTEGEVRVDERLVSAPSRDAAMVFQQPALFPWKTVIGNVAVGLRARGLSRSDARDKAHQHLAAVGLDDFVDRYPHELSGGMAQRVGIARALALEPRLLLMDEPFAAVDAQTRLHLQSELLSLMRGGTVTAVFVTHDVSEAVYLGDQVLVMSARPGRIVTQMPMETASRDRSSPYFAATTAQIVDLLEQKSKG